MKIPNRLQLANIPTPLHKIIYRRTEFFLKRDDFTGVEYSGNKIRKLDYLLYDALHNKAEYIFTCGGDQSNHARATAAACLNYGLKPVLFLWGKDQSDTDGNLFLNKLFRANIIYLSKQEYDNVNQIMNDMKQKYENKGRKVYVIPEGGSSALGIWGYINFINELMQQTDIKKINKIFIAAGSGGTAAGLMLGIHLNKLNMKVSAVNVLYSRQEIRTKIMDLAQACINEYDLDIKIDPDMLEIIDGYSNEGYKHIHPSKVSLIKDFAANTGIIFDPAYTGKAFCAFNDLVIREGISDCLFLHTGGLFGVFSKRKEYSGF
jgi:D-cysteine desulfhydrase